VLAALERALGACGLNVVAPMAAAAFDAACAPVSTLTLGGLLAGARAAVLVGSGGPAFFDRFAAGSPEASDGAPHPLDRFTKRVADAAVVEALAPLGIAHAAYFPFDWAEPRIPFQRLGRAVGLGGPGPLGLQIHPVYGAWWAYRVLVVVDRAAGHRRRLRGLRCAMRGRVPGACRRADRVRGRGLSRAPAGRRTVPAVVRGADRVHPRSRPSLYRRRAGIPHGGVDAQTVTGLPTA
jgi:hypothetical protein